MRHSDAGTSRREFLQRTAAGAAAIAGSLACTGCGAQGGARPNVLWIIAEDFSPDLGCYGNKLVQTPNIDRLAAEGVRYTHAFVTGPVCSASRSALVTGMYQTSIGGHNHRSHRDDDYRLPEGVRPFTHFLREAGYHTSNLRAKASGIGGTGKTDFNFNVENVYDGDDWGQRNPGQPFYAQINFSETHRAFERFPDRPVNPADVELPPYYPDHPAVREDWAVYLDTAQHLDVKVGKVLDRLEKEGLAEDTIVFFFGDHGRPMPRGKQFLYEGGIRIPLIVRIPEKFRPAEFMPGSVEERMLSHIDITATTLKFAGVEPPENMEGQVFLGGGAKFRDHVIAARDRCDETVDRIRAVRTTQYKYIRNYYPERPYTQQNIYKDTSYPPLRVMRDLKAAGKLKPAEMLFMADTRPPKELYDLGSDPHEIRNLAGMEEYKAKLAELSGILDTWIQETGDKGEIPENRLPDEYKYRTQFEGWSTSNCIASKSGVGLKIEFDGKNAALQRSVVAEAGKYSLRFRARSTDAPVQAISWGLIHDMRDEGNRVAIDFLAGNAWQEYRADFEATGFLGRADLRFGSPTGTLELDWIRLFREDGGSKLIEEWTFA